MKTEMKEGIVEEVKGDSNSGIRSVTPFIPQPVSAIAGGFSSLPHTPKPLGVDLLSADYRRCPGCREVYHKDAFRYPGSHAKQAARCAECREKTPGGSSPHNMEYSNGGRCLIPQNTEPYTPAQSIDFAAHFPVKGSL